MRRWFLPLVVGSLFAAAAIPPAVAQTATAPLTVVGNRIVDPQGNTVVLRGLHRDGTQGGPAASVVTPTADELGWMGNAHAGSWNANVIRVPVGAAQWTGACPTLSTDAAGYRAKIDAEIGTITTQGIVALLDLHTVTAGCTSIAAHAMPDAPVATSFWNDAAQHYAGHPLVAFELYNEPHFVPDSEWLSGTSGATAQDCDLTVAPSPDTLTALQQKVALLRCQLKAPKYQAVGMQQLYDIVSSVAPGHLVVVDGPGYAGSPPSLPINASRGQLVYALHPYTCPVPGAPCDGPSGAHANLDALNRWTNVAQTSPVLVTEMGFPVYPKSDGTGYVDGSGFYRETLAFLQAQSPQWGFVAFVFDGKSQDAFSLITSTTDYTPNTTGQLVYDLLRS